MQFGLPILTTNSTPWVMLEEKDIGWIIDGDLKDIYKILKKVLSVSKEELEKKSINAINFSKNYNWDRIQNKYFELYQKINQND